MPLAVLRFDSRALVGNSLGDPTERDLHVWSPPGVADDQPLPALLALTGFTGTGAMLFNGDPLGEGLGARMTRLIASGVCPPCRVIAPDCFTRLGGNQYLDSSATGRYEAYVMDEILPFVDARYATTGWAVFGRSSGGFGAFWLGSRHPDRFHALADHSGDAVFELCYLPDVSGALDAWRAAGGPAAWLDRFWADPNRRRSTHAKPLNMLAMAAHYSPDPASPHLGIAFPFDLDTGRLRPEIWARWKAHDPVELVGERAAALRALRLVYVDCGTRDEYALHWGARALVAELRAHGVAPVHEEFDDGHGHIGYRYDVSLPRLVRAING